MKKSVIENRARMSDYLAYPLGSYWIGEQVHETKVLFISKHDPKIGVEDIPTKWNNSSN